MDLPDGLPDELKQILQGLDAAASNAKDKHDTDKSLMQLEMADINSTENLRAALVQHVEGTGKRFNIGDIVRLKDMHAADKKHAGPFIITHTRYKSKTPYIFGVYPLISVGHQETCADLNTHLFGTEMQIQCMFLVGKGRERAAKYFYFAAEHLKLIDGATDA